MRRYWLLVVVVARAVVIELDGMAVDFAFEGDCSAKHATSLRGLLRHPQQPVIGEGCPTTECSAIVLVASLFPEECEKYASEKLSEIQLASQPADLGASLKIELAYSETTERQLPAAYLAQLERNGWMSMPGEEWPTLIPESWIRRAMDIVENEGRKLYEFWFVGALSNDASTRLMRRWVVDFARQHFTNDSYLAFTDVQSSNLGSFDYSSSKRKRWNPKRSISVQETAAIMASDERALWIETLDNFGSLSRLVRFDQDYYETLARAKLALAPAGDGPWSHRFFEAMMVCSIPIVQRKEHAGRTQMEKDHVEYYYYVYDREIDEYPYRENWATHNFRTLLRHHSLINIPGGEHSQNKFESFRCPRWAET